MPLLWLPFMVWFFVDPVWWNYRPVWLVIGNTIYGIGLHLALSLLLFAPRAQEALRDYRHVRDGGDAGSYQQRSGVRPFDLWHRGRRFHHQPSATADAARNRSRAAGCLRLSSARPRELLGVGIAAHRAGRCRQSPRGHRALRRGEASPGRCRDRASGQGGRA